MSEAELGLLRPPAPPAKREPGPALGVKELEVGGERRLVVETAFPEVGR